MERRGLNCPRIFGFCAHFWHLQKSPVLCRAKGIERNSLSRFVMLQLFNSIIILKVLLSAAAVISPFILFSNSFEMDKPKPVDEDVLAASLL